MTTELPMIIVRECGSYSSELLNYIQCTPLDKNPIFVFLCCGAFVCIIWFLFELLVGQGK